MFDQPFETVDITETGFYAVGFRYQFISMLCSCAYSKRPEYYYIYLN